MHAKVKVFVTAHSESGFYANCQPDREPLKEDKCSSKRLNENPTDPNFQEPDFTFRINTSFRP